MSDTNIEAARSQIFESPESMHQLGKMLENTFRENFESVRGKITEANDLSPKEKQLKLRTDLIVRLGAFLELDPEAIENDLQVADDAFVNDGGEG